MISTLAVWALGAVLAYAAFDIAPKDINRHDAWLVILGWPVAVAIALLLLAYIHISARDSRRK